MQHTMTDAQHLIALERAIDGLIRLFGATPDVFLGEADLQAALFGLAQAEAPLGALHRTRDGRHTTLLHRDAASFVPRPGSAVVCHDMALLNPNLIRGHDLAGVADRSEGVGRPAIPLGDAERMPFLAVLTLRLLADLSLSALIGLQEDLGRLDMAEPEATNRYLAVFCRHWDLQGQIRNAIGDLQRLAGAHPRVAIVVAQSHYDDIGHVFGACYFNTWSHRAPLEPLY